DISDATTRPVKSNRQNTRWQLTAITHLFSQCSAVAALYDCRNMNSGSREKRARSQTAVTVTRCAAIQKRLPAIPVLPGAYVGRSKCAAGAVTPSGGSVTTPSSLDDAQAQSTHTITKATTPDKAARLFTEENVPIADTDATIAG